MELLNRLEAEARSASEDEKRTLVRYVGWGGPPRPPQVFDARNEDSLNLTKNQASSGLESEPQDGQYAWVRCRRA